MEARETMRAVVARESGGPDVLGLGRLPVPIYGDEELLVRVHATALNRADLLQREGTYPSPPGASSVLGLEMAGTIEAAGNACTNWRIGDRVCGLLSGGGYAEYAVVDRDLAMPLLPCQSFEDGAAIPEAFLTAFQALHWYGEIAAGRTVLIHAGASGVGTAGIQLAAAVGATVVVTASSGKHEACRQLGASETIDYRTEDFAERLADITGGRGADVIVDFVGAPYFERNVQSLSVDGRLILLGTLGGSRVNAIKLRDLFLKRASVFASTLRSRGLSYKRRLTRDFSAHAMPLFERGVLRPVIDRIMPWTEVAEAHRIMGANRNVGKIVLRVQ